MRKLLPSSLIRWGTCLPAIVVIGFFLLRQISDYDVWFHLNLGKEILRNGLPATDLFTQLSLGRPLHDSQWLFQLLLAAGYMLVGTWWLQAVQIGCWCVILWFVHRSARVWASPTMSCLLLILATIASEERFTARPEIVTYLMVVVFAWRLQQRKYQRWTDMALLVFLQTVWTNSHGIFVIGPFLVSCYLISATIKGIRDKEYGEIRSLALLTGATTVACLVSPYGWGSIRFAWLLFTEVGPGASQVLKMVHEMASPLGESARQCIAFWAYLTLIAAFLTSWLAVLIHCREKLSLARTLTGFTLLAISLTARRNLPLFALVAAPLIAEHLALIGSVRLRRTCFAAIATVMVTAGVSWSPRPALQYLRYWAPYRIGIGISPVNFPLGLPAFLDRIGFSGPVFNSLSLGGYYGFHRSPPDIPFYDARLEAHDQQKLLLVFATIDNANSRPEPWHNLVQQYGFRGLLIEHGSGEAMGLLHLISRDPKWQLAYLDYAASFWVSTGNQNMPPAVDATTVANLAAQAQNRIEAENLNYFLDRTGMFPELRLLALERTRQFWENPAILKDIGLLQVKMGKLVEADRTFRQLLVSNPKERMTLTTLAQIALLRGDRDTAEKFLLQALSYYPDDRDLRENLGRIRNVRP